MARALRGQAVKERREAIRRKRGDGGKSAQGAQCPGSAGPGPEEKQVGLLNIRSVKEKAASWKFMSWQILSSFLTRCTLRRKKTCR